MSLPPRHGGLEVERVGTVTVVTFLDRHILTEAQVHNLGEALFSLAEGSGGCRLVLNLGHVERLSSALLGKVMALHQKVRRAGGMLALCAVKPEIGHILRLLGLDKHLPLYPNEGQVLEIFV
jgi:anti-sigma B factor antagonist